MNKNVIIGIVVGLVVILIIVAIIILTNKKDTNPDGNTQQVVLEYWGLWEPASVMQPLIDKYQAQHKNVTIKYTQKTYTQYEENLYTRLKEGSITGSPAPDLFRIHNTWLSKYQSSLTPAPQSLITTSSYVTTFYPTAQQSFVGTDAQIYAIPLEVDGLTLYYNKQLFAQEGLVEPPATWDALIETAKKLTKTDSSGKITQAGIAIGTSKNITHSADILSLLMMQNKGNSEIIDATNTQMSISGDQYISALNFYTDFVKVHKTWSTDLPNDLEMFYTGKLAMMIAPSWTTFDIINSNSTVEFGIVPTPIVGTKEVYYGHYWAEAVSKNSANPAVAWDFINFLSQEAQLKEFYSNSSQIRAFGEPYSRKSMSTLLVNEPYVGAVMEMAPNLQSWKKGEEAFVNEAFNTAITAVVENNVEPSSALLEAQKRINEKLATSIK